LSLALLRLLSLPLLSLLVQFKQPRVISFAKQAAPHHGSLQSTFW
jgi:hypothetical protein